MRQVILQKSIPYEWQKVTKLPGVMPLNPQEWIIFDDAYIEQMAEREVLLKNNNDVIVIDKNSEDAAREPLLTCGLLVQNDFCVLQKIDGQHVLSAAVLCFPANWRLKEKFMKPLFSIHRNVPEYSPEIAKRVDRLFDCIRVAQPMWRFNVLDYSDPTLYQPYRRNIELKPSYTRSERQTFLKLPNTGAVVFGIHTFVIKKVPLGTL